MKTTGYRVEGDSVIERNTFDAEPALERAKSLHNSGQHGSEELKHAAHIPEGLAWKYCQLKGITWNEFMADTTHIVAMLNDPDLASFRIWKGKVTR